MPPSLLTSAHREELLANGRRTTQGEELDPHPVLKLFMPDGPGTWLLTELDPAEPTRAFGLCDPGSAPRNSVTSACSNSRPLGAASVCR